MRKKQIEENAIVEDVLGCVMKKEFCRCLLNVFGILFVTHAAIFFVFTKEFSDRLMN